MQHTKLSGTPTAKPLAIYIAEAHQQIAHTRATSNLLNGTRSRDADLALAIAQLDRAADRSKGRGL